MASAAEQEECAHRAKRQHIDHSVDIVQLPYEILEAIFRTLPTPVILHRVGAVCKDWHSIIKDDDFWRLRCGLTELPSDFDSWFAYDQRQTMREQGLDHLYGRAGVTQNWYKGLQLLSVLAGAGDDYAMALCGYVMYDGVGIRLDEECGEQLLRQSKHVIARAFCAIEGMGVNADGEAYRLLTTECDTSDPLVQYLLGWCHQMGFGCKQDTAQAILWYECAGNHIEAVEALATLLVEEKRPLAS